MAFVPKIEGMNDNDIVELAVTALIPAVLIGLNRLAWEPGPMGRGWRASRALTWFGVRAVVVGVIVVEGCIYLDTDFRTWGETLVAEIGLTLYFGGMVLTLLSLILRLWLRLDMGPAEAARFFLFGFFRFVGFVVLGWFMGFRNLVFLRILKGRPLFEDEPRAPSPYGGMSYKEIRRTYGTPPG